MSVGDIIFRSRIDDKQFKRDLSKLKSEGNRVGKDFWKSLNDGVSLKGIKEFTRGISTSKSQFADMCRSANEAVKEYTKLSEQAKRAQARFDAMSPFSEKETGAYANLRKELEGLYSTLDELVEKEEFLKGSDIEFGLKDVWADLQNEIGQTGEKIGEVETEMARLNDTGGRYQQNTKWVVQKRELEELRAQMEKTRQKAEQLTDATNNVGKGMGFRKFFSDAKDKISGMIKKVPILNGQFKGLGRSARRSGQGISHSMGMAMRRMFGVIGAGAILYKTFQMTRDGLMNLAQADSRTANSIAQLRGALAGLKNALGSAFAPILNVVAPILTKFIGMLTKTANSVASFISALLGQKYVVVANSVGKISNGFGGVGKSASGANKKAKELQRTLMGFDKINKLDSKNDTGSGGSGGGGSGGGAGGGFSVVPVDPNANKWADKFKESWKNADFYWLGDLLATKINTALSNIPWKKINQGGVKFGKSLGTFLNGCVENLDWGLLAKTISNGILVAFNTLSSFFETVNWGSVGKSIVDFLCGIKWGSLFKGFFRLIGNILGGLLGVIVGAVKRVFQKAKKYFGKYSKKSGGDVIKGFFVGIKEFIKGVPKWIMKNIVKPFINGFKKAFGISSPSKVMKEQGGYVISGLFEGIKSKVDDIKDWFKELPSKIKEWIGDKIDIDLDFSGLGDGAENLAGKTVDMVANFTSWVKGTNFGSTIGDMVSKFTSWVKGFDAGTISGWVANFTEKAVDTAKVIGQKVAGWIADFTKTDTGKLVAGTISGWVAKYTSVASGLKKLAKKQVRGTIGGFQAKLSSWKSGLPKPSKKHPRRLYGFTAIISSWIDNAKNKFSGKKKNKADGGVYKNGRWSPIQRYAEGGLPNGSQLFWAREAGPELVGTLGGRTAVMNNDQIVASVSSGVAKAISGIRFKLNATPKLANVGGSTAQKTQPQVVNDNSQVEALLRVLIAELRAKDMKVTLDGKEIANNTVKHINQNTRATGKLAIIV